MNPRKQLLLRIRALRNLKFEFLAESINDTNAFDLAMDLDVIIKTLEKQLIKKPWKWTEFNDDPKMVYSMTGRPE